MPFTLRPAAPQAAARRVGPVAASSAARPALRRSVAAAPAATRPAPRRSVAARASKHRFFVGGNWKAHGTRDLVESLTAGLADAEIPHTAEVVVAPPFLYLLDVHRFLLSSRGAISVSAQDCRVGGNGAFTGDVTADMLTDAGVPWVIVGHSERRTLHGETDAEVEAKTRYALSKGLAVIACIGETLEEREGGRLDEVLSRQLAAIVRAVGSGEGWARAVVAYEPVWAIGTGKVATPEQAQETHALLRARLAGLLADLGAPADLAASVRIIYGGSVNAGNAATLAALKDVDGFLVGGASLKPDSFLDIIAAGAGAN